MKFGAIDIGTNAARLLIGEVTENGNVPFIKKISYTRVPLRLGMDVFSIGRISDHKIIELRKTIQAFNLLAEVHNVVDLRACATSAMREAVNGFEVRNYIGISTKVDIEIIDGEQESVLLMSNFYEGNKKVSDEFVVIDVGGGSTEVSIFEKGEVVTSKSFEIGTIRLLKDKVVEEMWSASKSWLKKNIKKRDVQVFAMGGNINKSHKLLGKKSNETIRLDEFKELSKSINALTPRERINNFKLKEDRADVIGPATKIYLHFFKYMGCDEVHVPKMGLSDGIIHGLHQKYQNQTV